MGVEISLGQSERQAWVGRVLWERSVCGQAAADRSGLRPGFRRGRADHPLAMAGQGEL